MIILGIETSCDDTGVAIIRVSGKQEPIFEILSNVVSSQIKTHAPFGGVVPNLAAREHLKNIEPCLKTALKEANVKLSEIDLIAVTTGLGLIPSLLIGVNFAKALAYKYNIPIVGVNHIEAHIIAALNGKFSRVAGSRFAGPAIALTVSGGHTQLVLVKSIGKYKIIGETRDDAAGECFDKVAKLLNLGYPGGPIISKIASAFAKATADKTKFKLPRPMLTHKNYDFSFSGLKTAVLYLTQDNKNKMKNEKFIQEICRETQQAMIDVLISKTLRAAEEYKAKTIILAGGVAANEELRQQFKLKIENLKLSARGGSAFGGKIEFLTPSKILCTDNGAMIAMAGYLNKNKASKNYDKIKADANLRLS